MIDVGRLGHSNAFREMNPALAVIEVHLKAGRVEHVTQQACFSIMSTAALDVEKKLFILYNLKREKVETGAAEFTGSS